MIIKNKRLAFILVLLLVVSMGTVGCGDEDKKASSDKKTESNKNTDKDNKNEDSQGLTVIEDGSESQSEDEIDFSELEANEKKESSNAKD